MSKPDTICTVCQKPVGWYAHRFMHWMRHVQEGKAYGIMNPHNGMWNFYPSFMKGVKIVQKPT